MGKKEKAAGLILVLLFVSVLACWASQKLEVEIVSSDQSTQSYDVPARLACVPGTYGPTCAARGAETRTVGYVQLSAKINGMDVLLTCNSVREKHCRRFQPGKYPAEAKGKDEVILYAWSNPMYRGDLSKATKVKFKIGGR
jgi:hypothetical protein